MNTALSSIAAVAATVFAAELWLNYRRRPRPHVAAYGAGMSMFALATWALFFGVTLGWTGPLYRTFYLFGAILNIPFLALGSMFLVVGKRSGHVMTIALGALTAISTTLTLTVPFESPLPESGIPTDIFAPGFGPRLFAVIGGAVGTVILLALALASLFRFWKKDRQIVWGNALIVAGTASAAWRGTGLALGDAGGFALSLLLAVSLIWAGYKVASGRRSSGPPGKGKEPERQDGVNQLERDRA
jgi:hypothetical protein